MERGRLERRGGKEEWRKGEEEVQKKGRREEGRREERSKERGEREGRRKGEKIGFSPCLPACTQNSTCRESNHILGSPRAALAP